MDIDNLTAKQLAKLALLLKQAGYVDKKPKGFFKKPKKYNWYSVFDGSLVYTGTITEARAECKKLRWRGVTNLVAKPV